MKNALKVISCLILFGCNSDSDPLVEYQDTVQIGKWTRSQYQLDYHPSAAEEVIRLNGSAEAIRSFAAVYGEEVSQKCIDQLLNDYEVYFVHHEVAVAEACFLADHGSEKLILGCQTFNPKTITIWIDFPSTVFQSATQIMAHEAAHAILGCENKPGNIDHTSDIFNYIWLTVQ